MAPIVSSAQVRAVVERALRRGSGQNLILVSGSPSSDVMAVDVADLSAPAQVHGTSSPLGIRQLSRQAEKADAKIVVVTDLTSAELGDDLIVRSVGQKIWAPDRWEAVRGLLGVRSFTRDLADKQHLADALIEAQPPEGYPKMRSTTLDMQGALAALLKAQLGISDAVNSLDRFLAWIHETEGSAKRVVKAAGAVNTETTALFDEHLVLRFGQGVLPVLAILRSENADHLMPMLLTAGAIHHPDAEEGRGAYELELETNRVALDPEWWRQASDAAHAMASPDVLQDERQRLAWSTAGFDRLDRYKVPQLAERSPAIEAGFEQRLATVGKLLAHAAEEPSAASVSDSLRRALAEAQRHWFADPVRVDRAEMAWRLIRRGNESIVWGNRLADAGQAYKREGAWIDRARNAIARGDSVPELASIYQSLGQSFMASRHEDNRSFAALAQSAAKPLPDDVLGIEDLVTKVVANVAETNPVLLLVFDGMGYESFTEVAPLFESVGFTAYVDPDGIVDKPCFAALPTVTEKSRTSLFAGTVRSGNQKSEERAFIAIPVLVAASKAGNPPLVHHKAALREGGIDGRPETVLDSISNDHQQVVAVVVNNIDERLKDVAGPVSTWGFAELHPLRPLLDEARAAGRVVIVASDHGHVLDRDGEQRTIAGASERWRPADNDPSDDEILVEGPRVVTTDHRAILPFREQLHYDSRRNGYHGGLCPQEVLIPVAVYATRDDMLPDWSVTAFNSPAWWAGLDEPETPAAAVVSAPAPKKSNPPKGVDEETPTLFDTELDEDPPANPTQESWVTTTLAALAPYRRHQRLKDEEIVKLLTALEQTGDQALPMDRLAAMTALPSHRMTGYITQLQSIVNIDGYSVLSVIANEVRFEKQLLNTQLEANS